ncbi:MAG: D-(-)-3-hydroxybutyrate oligomer hydrolase [Burkholderiales bacterium]|nr:D-(-)-3-hydroxybutyrate oligomer hydrolase [Burkholderiales bacterium]
MALHHRAGPVVLAATVSALLAGCSGDNVTPPDVNPKPGFVGTITKSSYDGNLDDLLTAGLGKTGLAGAAPTYADPLNPTAAELRKLAIYNNYRAIVDIAANGGYGSLYGPNIDVNGNPTLGEGKVAGTEYLAYADDGGGRQNVTMMVQIPASFSKASPCMVTATSSGSRGVYGAIGSAGEWGLKRGCIVAYTDKGTGTGFHDLATNTVTQQNGVRAGAAAAGKNSNFTADLAAADLAAFNAATPNRVAVKHAHSQQNPEKDWGRDTLNAVRFAFYVVNEERGDRNSDGTARNTFRPDNTIVIASSVSNGAGAAVAALEQDAEGLLDGLAVTEPNVVMPPGGNLVVRRGNVTTNGSGRALYDYFTLANLLQPCAALSAAAQGSPGAGFVNTTIATNRCASLKAKGYLTGNTTAELAADAMNQLQAYGWQPESNLLHASHYAFATFSITMTYSNTYGRFSVRDNLCGLSFAATDAATFKPVPLSATALAQSFGGSNGVPPSVGVNIVNNDAPGGPVNTSASVSPSTGLLDYNIDAAKCQRDLWLAADAFGTRVQNGVKETHRTANLRGRPAIIVHGRADALVPVAFSSRPYYGMNRIVEGAASKLTYVEVTNAQHFDAFIDNAALPGYDTMFVPLHYYFVKAMDAMWAHLTLNVPLPPAQVVRTVPRGGTPGQAPAITAANVPPILAAPPAANQITFAGNTLTIPD